MNILKSLPFCAPLILFKLYKNQRRRQMLLKQKKKVGIIEIPTSMVHHEGIEPSTP